MTQFGSSPNYRLGSLYSVATAFLLATQEPFSFLASIPLLLTRSVSRRDFFALLSNPTNLWRLAVIFAIGLTGLLLYNAGLSNAHPIIIAAILNLSPFWAALVARVISKKPIPISRSIFFGCLAGAFAGAMAIPLSQMDSGHMPSLASLAESALHGSWIYAIPVPICSALGGTLIGKWFVEYDESAAIAANFMASTLVLIPSTTFILYQRAELPTGEALPIALMIVGTIVAASLGRVLYQISLSVTDNDNGFVTMFFLLVPVLTSLISLSLSWWIPDLHFAAGALFALGLVVNASALLLFSLKSWL